MKRLFLKTIPLSIFFSIFAHAQNTDIDTHATRGIAYLNGELGVTEKTIQMPNCPYENCDESIDKDGMRLVKIPVKDYKSAVNELSIAVNGGSPKAAEALFEFLKGLINYKDRKPNGFLIEKMKEDTGLNYQEWQALLGKSLGVLVVRNNCKGVYFEAERSKKGWITGEIDMKRSDEFFEKVLHICPESSFEYMIASSQKE